MKFKNFKKATSAVFEPDGAGSIREHYDGVDVSTISPLITAYVGDAWFHLFVRTRLLAYEQGNVRVLDHFCARIVSAVWQTRAYLAIEPMLTDDEREIFRRGRNSHSHAPRSASVGEYHTSTGFESLLGTLYLSGARTRLYEIAEAAFHEIACKMMQDDGGST